MSKTNNQRQPFRDGGSVEDRLVRLLETPLLARLVPHLPPETLHQLIRHRGLDACGDLVTSATPAQLASLLDLDLWREDRPGRDQQFDVERFGEWLEVLVDTGPATAARTVASLDSALVVAGLSRHVRVFDLGIFEPTAQSDDETIDRHDAMREGDTIAVNGALEHEAADAGLECELAGYVVRGRRGGAWDAILALLTALAEEHEPYFHDVMQGVRQLSNSRPEIDGLDDLLLAPEQHLHEVAIQREHRRSRQGYATPGDARAFLQMARQGPSQSGGSGSVTRNPIVAAYFRAADEAPEALVDQRTEDRSSAASRPSGAAEAAALPEDIEAVLELLTEAGVMPQRPLGLLESAAGDPQAAKLARLRHLMEHVRDSDVASYFTRTRELAFLANALAAGCSVQSRPFTAVEASDAAASVCNLGLGHWPAGWGDTGAKTPAARDHGGTGATPPDAFLLDHDLVTAFEVGWSVLHREVSMFAVQQLIATLDDLRSVDPDVRRGLLAFRRTLVQQRDAGTPWLARGAAEILLLLDPTAWVGVLGLLDECPVVPAALTAIVQGRTSAVSPTAFEFVSTPAQIDEVRLFLRKLPDVLAR